MELLIAGFARPILAIADFPIFVIAGLNRLRYLDFRLVGIVRVGQIGVFGVIRLLVAARFAVVAAAGKVERLPRASTAARPAFRFWLSAVRIMFADIGLKLAFQNHAATHAGCGNSIVHEHGSALVAGQLPYLLLCGFDDMVSLFLSANAIAPASHVLMGIVAQEPLALNLAPAVTIAMLIYPQMVCADPCVKPYAITPDVAAHGTVAASIDPIILVLLAASAGACVGGGKRRPFVTVLTRTDEELRLAVAMALVGCVLRVVVQGFIFLPKCLCFLAAQAAPAAAPVFLRHVIGGGRFRDADFVTALGGEVSQQIRAASLVLTDFRACVGGLGMVPVMFAACTFAKALAVRHTLGIALRLDMQMRGLRNKPDGFVVVADAVVTALAAAMLLACGFRVVVLLCCRLAVLGALLAEGADILAYLLAVAILLVCGRHTRLMLAAAPAKARE